jgi:SSS family transporter
MAVRAPDLIIVVVYLAATVALGMWLGRGQKQLSEYLLGGRSIPWWAVLGSIVATETSTATFLSVPGIAYGGDFRFLQLAFGYILGRALVAWILLPHYFRGELYTAYEVLNLRFGLATKRTASLLFLVTRNLSDGLRLFLMAVVLEKMFGWPLATCIVITGVITIFYTLVGGMKSVVWNDCIQFVIYVTAAIAACAIIVGKLPGGWDELMRFAAERQKFRLIETRFDLSEKYTLWAGLVGGMFLTLGTHGTDQMMVQRYLSARGPRPAAVALVLSGFVVLAQFALFLLIGVALARFNGERPYVNTDHAFPEFIVAHLPVGLVGLTLAGILAAAMSTLSSSLNSSAAAVVNDLYLPLKQTPPPPASLVRLSRLLTLVFGVVQIGVGLGAQRLSENVVNNVLAIAGFTAGILLGVFLLGVLTRRVGQAAVLVGMVAGIAAVTSVKFGTSVAWPWFAVVGAGVTGLVGLGASLVAPRRVERQA